MDEKNLADTVFEAMALRDRMLADGSTPKEARDYLTDVLKSVWPRQRIEPWHYYCETCNDTGWEMLHCGEGHRCGRPFCEKNSPHHYVRPCFCDRGQHIVEAVRKKQPAVEDAGVSRKMRRLFQRDPKG